LINLSPVHNIDEKYSISAAKIQWFFLPKPGNFTPTIQDEAPSRARVQLPEISG
jgi:hypothetical protein